MCIMVSSVAYVSSMSVTPSTSAASRLDDILAQQAADFLQIALDTPQADVSCAGGTLADRFVLEGAAGADAYFAKKREGILGPTTQANLYFHNGHAALPLSQQFDGLANAGLTLPYDPDWRTGLIATDVSAVAGLEPLDLAAAGVFDGALIRAKGESIRTTLTLSDGRVVTTWSNTALLPANLETRAHLNNISWTKGTGTAVLSSEYLPTPQDPRFVMHLRPQPSEVGTASYAVPPEIRVAFPPEWTVNAATSTGAWSFRYENETPESDAVRTLIGTLVTPDASSLDIALDLLPPSTPTRPFDVLRASLGNGSLGETGLVVTYPVPAQADLPRAAYATTPYPLRHGANATFGVAFLNGGPQVSVTQIDVEIPGGYDLAKNGGRGVQLFAETPAALNGTAYGGSWSRIDAQHLRWVGSKAVSPGKAAGWLYSVKVTSDLSQETSVEPPEGRGPVSTLRFPNGYVSESTSWGASPGILRHEVLPASAASGSADGYAWSSLGAQDVSLALAGRGVTVEASGEYEVVPDGSSLVRIDNALGNGSAAVRERLVPVGGVAVVDVDLASAVTTLAAEGASSVSLRVDVYSPAGVDCPPVWSYVRETAALPRAPLAQLESRDAVGLGATSVFAIGMDNNLYRVEDLGLLAWSKLGAAAFTALDSVGQPGDVALYLGDALGGVERRDDLGELAWSASMGSAIVGLDASESGVLVATGTSLALLDAQTGATLAQRELTTTSIAWGPAGRIYAIQEGALLRLDGSLATVASYGDDIIRMGVADGALFATLEGSAESDASVRLGLDDLAPGALREHLGESLMASVGDATGDGIGDYVVATSGLAVDVLDGATGALARREPLAAPQLTSATAEVPTIKPTEYGAALDRGATLEACGATAASYQAGRVCLAVEDPANQALVARGLLAADGAVSFSYSLANVDRLAHWRQDGSETYSILPGASGPLAGGVRLGGQRVVLMATPNGTLDAYDEATGALAWSREVSSQVGRLSIRFPVPDGAFYGAHLVKTSLLWDQGGRPTEARLLDWFEVVGADGLPVTRPAYRLVLAVRDPFAPPATDALGAQVPLG